MIDVITIKDFPNIIEALPGQGPWPVVDCEGLGQLNELDTSQPQLLTWLTLPLAAEAFSSLVVEPNSAREVEKGLTVLPAAKSSEEYLDDRFTAFRRKLHAGNAAVPFTHGAYHPDQPDTMQWLLPVGSSTQRYVTLSTQVAFARKRGVFTQVKPRVKEFASVSRKLMDNSQAIPGSRNVIESSDPTLRSLKDPTGRGRARQQFRTSIE